MPKQTSRSPQKNANKLLEDWGRESPARDITIQGIRTRILQLSAIISRANEKIARGFGITGPEMRVLFALRRAGSPYRLRPTDLYESLLVPSSSLTRQVDRLEELGMVHRLEDPNDRRGFLVELTSQGIRDADAALAAALDQSDVTHALQKLTATERTRLATLLEAVQANLTH